MSAAEMREILREDYGIQNDEEFEAAVSNSAGIDIGMFTEPYKGGGSNEKVAVA